MEIIQAIVLFVAGGVSITLIFLAFLILKNKDRPQAQQKKRILIVKKGQWKLKKVLTEKAIDAQITP